MNLAWWLERATWEHGDKVAVIDGPDGTQKTYSEMTALSNRIGNVLKEEVGVVEGEVVVTLLPDDHRHMATMYGLLKIGAVFSGLNAKSIPDKLERDVATCGARTLVVGREYLDAARALRRDTGIENVLVCDGVADGVESEFPDLLEMASDAPNELGIAPRAGAEVAAVNFTSGTSGASKGVVFTHEKLGLSATGTVFHDGLRSTDTDLGFISLFHSAGIHDAVKWVVAGGTLVWSGGWDADRAVRLIEEHEPTWMYFWIPTMVRDAMRHPGWDSLDLRGVKAYLSGEPVPADIHRTLVEQKGMRVGIVYGLTETMPVGILKPSFRYGEDEIAPFGSTGKPNKELCEVVLKDPFSGGIVEGPGEGEVCVRGEVVTPGYHNDPERTAEDLDAQGFFRTKDLARRDEEGWYWVGGRTDDLISTGGEKLSIHEVDDVLLGHPKVEDAACIGVDHERLGQVPAAFVVPVEPAEEDEIRETLDAYCKENLERWKRPRLYAVVEEVPRTAAKRSKSLGDLKGYVEGIVLADEEGVTTLSRARAEAKVSENRMENG